MSGYCTNLLVYARDPSLDPETEVDLVELMHRFIKILEVPTRTKGLKIRSLLSDKPLYFKTKAFLVTECLENIGIVGSFKHWKKFVKKTLIFEMKF